MRRCVQWMVLGLGLALGCGEDPRQAAEWDNDGDPRTSGPGAYDSSSSVRPLGQTAIGESEGPVSDPPEGPPPPLGPETSEKVGPDSYGVRTPSGAAGEGRGWGGSGFGSNVRSRVQGSERGMDGGTVPHSVD